jgi:hypothetical protein
MLRPTECIDAEKASALASTIAGAGVWTHELLIHDDCHAVLDGHHRLAAAKLLGLRSVPCRLVRYGQAGLSLHAWREGDELTPEMVLSAAASGTLLPFKTTRHVLACAPSPVRIPLNRLIGD